MAITANNEGSFPLLLLEIDPSSLTDFTLDLSPLGGSAPLGTNSTWTSLPNADIQQISVRRGRKRPDQANDSGTLVVTLDNLSGNYDPDNRSSSNPYVVGGRSWWTAGVAGRLTAIWNGVRYPMFYGRLEDPVADLGMMPMATFTFVDGIADASAALPSFALLAETTAQRSNRALDAIGWPATARTVGGALNLLASGQNSSATAVLEECAKAERGRFYIDNAGNARLATLAEIQGRSVKLTLTDNPATGQSDYFNIRSSPGMKYIVNEATVTAGTYVSTVTNTNSIAVTRVRKSQNVSVPLAAAADADTLATWLANHLSVAATRVEQVEIAPLGLDLNAWANLLATDLTDKTTVQRQGANGLRLNVTVSVLGIDHDVTAENWRTSMYTAPVDSTGAVFTLDTSLLNGSDVLA